MTNYDSKYSGEELYWGTTPSDLCYRILTLLPPTRPLRVLDIGCGEGRNAIFLARNGYDVAAFDISSAGVKKTKAWASRLSLSITAFDADIVSYRLQSNYDIIFSTGTLHYLPIDLRDLTMRDIKKNTAPGGLNAFSVFVDKPFIPPAPDAESNAFHWNSGLLLSYYHDWIVEFSEETIFDCSSGGMPHKHAVNRIIARKPPES